MTASAPDQAPARTRTRGGAVRRYGWWLLATVTAAGALLWTGYVVTLGGYDPETSWPLAAVAVAASVAELVAPLAMLVAALRRTWVHGGVWPTIRAALTTVAAVTTVVLVDAYSMKVQTNGTWTAAAVVAVVASAGCWWIAWRAGDRSRSRLPWALPAWAGSWTVLMLAVGVQSLAEFNGVNTSVGDRAVGWADLLPLGAWALLLAATAAAAVERATRRQPADTAAGECA